MVGPISSVGSYGYQPIQYGFAGSYGVSMPNSRGVDDAGKILGLDGNDKVSQTGIDDPIAKASGKTECQTCKNRKYVDGSDENVSFKSAAKVAPEAAMARVSAHEQEHVSNAYKKAEEKGGKVLQASVTIKTAICPECGRSYVAGGVTNTRIAYPNDNNPYTKNRKATNYDALAGANFDAKT